MRSQWTMTKKIEIIDNLVLTKERVLNTPIHQPDEPGVISIYDKPPLVSDTMIVEFDLYSHGVAFIGSRGAIHKFFKKFAMGPGQSVEAHQRRVEEQEAIVVMKKLNEALGVLPRNGQRTVNLFGKSG